LPDSGSDGDSGRDNDSCSDADTVDLHRPGEDDVTAELPDFELSQTSVLADAGIEDGITLARPPARPDPTVPLGDDRSLHEMLSGTGAAQRYVIGEEVNRGGMGAILRGVDRDIRREVAIKVMLRSKDLDRRLRFIAEAQIQGQLEHPNIVPVHELGQDARGRFYFAMKLVRGRSLRQVLDGLRQGDSQVEQCFTRNRALDVFLAVCNAVAFAHSRGVVHRDLKPDNVMLGDFGEVLVMDWGLAKTGTASGVIASETGVDTDLLQRVQSMREESGSGHTRDGSVVGTPIYMPPEQAHGKLTEIDERSDVYSLGAILYELITWLPPVEGRTAFEVLRNVAAGKIVPPRTRVPERDIPAELEQIILKAMAHGKDDRYADVPELQQAIHRYQTHAESIVLAQEGAKELAKAGAAGDYNSFARAMITFEQALALWSDNETAGTGARDAREQYAGLAFEREDLELAADLLRDGGMTDSDLGRRVAAAQQVQRQRRTRLRVMSVLALAAGLVIIVLASVGYFLIRAERDRTRDQRDRAIEAEENTRQA